MESVKMFTRKDVASGRSHPVVYAQFGVLGELCLSRLNDEIHSYYRTTQDNPLGLVLMCDRETAPGSDVPSRVNFLQVIYEKVVGYKCVERYFKSVVQTNASGQELDQHERATVLKNALSNNELTRVLTDLCIFLLDNYHCTESNDDRHKLFEIGPSSAEADWIFYLAINPDGYLDILEDLNSYVSYFPDINVIALLEKPFQKTGDKAEYLAEKIEKWEESSKGKFKVFVVDHYAAKWSISQIPRLTATPGFMEFLYDVDHISVELVESKITDEHRFEYMGSTGLFFDMMPHVLTPLQFLLGPTVSVRLLSKPEYKFFGSYEGYVKDIKEWRKNHDSRDKKSVPLNETYFCAHFKMVVEFPDATGTHKEKEISFWFRSAKGMKDERKRVLLKRRGSLKGVLQIDIANDKFEISSGAGFAIPAKLVEAPEKTIRGYAKILFDLMQYIAALRENANADKPSTALMTARNAAMIIKEIEQIADFIGVKGAELTPYNPKVHMYLDESSELKAFSHFQ